MVDVSKTTGSKASRAGRTRISVATGADSASVNLRRTNRAIVATDGRAIEAQRQLAGQFADFFPRAAQGISDAVVGHMAATQRAANREEILRLETAVRLDPKGAREAVMSNDYSNFLSNETFASQSAVIDTFKSLSAREAAIDDFDNKISVAAQGLQAGDDVGAFIRDFTADQLKGADPLFSAEYSSIISNKSKPLIQQHNQALLNQQTVKSLEMTEAVQRSSLRDGTIPGTVEGLITMRTEAIASLPVQTPEAVDRATAKTEALLIDEAASGNGTAMRMLTFADPAHDGLSLAQRRPKEVEAAYAKAVNYNRQVRSLAAEEDLNKITDGMSLRAAGVEGAPAIADIMSNLLDHREVHGDSGKWRQSFNAALAMVPEQAQADDNLRRVANNQSVTYSQSELNKVAGNWFDGSVAREGAAQLGIPVERAQAMADKMLAQNGFGNDLKGRLSTNLLTSTNIDELAPLMSRLKTMDGVSSGGLNDTHLNKEALGMFSLMNAATDAGLDPFVVRQNYLENRDTLGDPSTYLERRVDDDGKPVGKAGVNAISKDIWNDNLAEIFPDNNTFFDGMSYDEVSQEAKIELQKAANQAASLTHGNIYNEDAVKTMAARLAKGKLGPYLDANGEVKMGLNKVPPFVVNSKGEIVPSKPVTKQSLERAQEAIENDPIVFGVINDFAGVEQDDLTTAGYGLAVKSNVNGIPMQMSWVPGERFVVPTDTLPTGNTFFQIEHNGDGTSTVNIPGPGDSVPLGKDGVTMKYIPEIGQWAPRYIDRGDARGADEVFGNVGDPVPGKDYRPPAELPEILEMETQENKILQGMRDRGQIVADPADGTEGLVAKLASATQRTKQMGYTADDLTKSPMASFDTRVVKHIRQVEGSRPRAYDDYTGKPVKAGTKVKGNVTIGNGFNLDDESNREIARKMGLNVEALRKGTAVLTKNQEARLTKVKIDEAHGWLKKKFRGVDLKQHQMEALISLAYNSRTNENGYTLIGPRLTRAIMDGNMEAAENEIRLNSSGGVPAHLQKAIMARRQIEADLFRGQQ